GSTGRRPSKRPLPGARKQTFGRRPISKRWPAVPKVSRLPLNSGLRDLEEMLRSERTRRFELRAVTHHGLRPGFLRLDHPAEELVLLRQPRNDLVPRGELGVQHRLRGLVDFHARFFELDQIFGVTLLPLLG